MRIKYLLVVLVVLIIINLISAVEISLSKDSYQPQETLQAEITGNFIDSLTINNILLYKQDIPRSTPIISDLTKFQDIYYLYIILPNQEANFSIKIKNTKYAEAGVEKTEDITEEFKIQRTNQSALQINPGFIRIIKDSNDFSLKVKGINNNQEVSAELEVTQETQDFSLAEDVEKTISFSITDIETGKTEIKINDYNIPVFIIKKTEIQNDSQEQNESDTTEEENQTKIDVTDMTEEEVQALNCEDFGELCEANEKCDGETKASLDGPCCIGNCTKEKALNYKWLIGIAIILIVIILAVFFYSKAKNRQKLKKHKEFLEEKSKKFEQRMGGEEVSGGIGRS